MSATLFSFLFLAALALMLVLKCWLALRQARCVAAHRDAVPADFAATACFFFWSALSDLFFFCEACF